MLRFAVLVSSRIVCRRELELFGITAENVQKPSFPPPAGVEPLADSAEAVYRWETPLPQLSHRATRLVQAVFGVAPLWLQIVNAPNPTVDE